MKINDSHPSVDMDSSNNNNRGIHEGLSNWSSTIGDDIIDDAEISLEDFRIFLEGEPFGRVIDVTSHYSDLACRWVRSNISEAINISSIEWDHVKFQLGPLPVSLGVSLELEKMIFLRLKINRNRCRFPVSRILDELNNHIDDLERRNN